MHSAADGVFSQNETLGTTGMGLSYLDKLDKIEGPCVESIQTSNLQMELETFLAANLSGKHGYQSLFNIVEGILTIYLKDKM